MNRHRALVLLAAGVVAAAGGWPRARADGEDLSRDLGALASNRPEARAQALARLEAVAARDPAALGGAGRALAGVLRRRGPAEAARAARLLASVPGEEGLRRWLDALDPAWPTAVWLAALDGAGRRAGDAATLRALLERARDPGEDPAGRALAVEAAGAIGAAARVLLTHPLAGEDGPDGWVLAAARARGLGRAPDPGGVEEALLDLLEHPDPAPRVAAWEVLVARTGLQRPAEAAAWRAPPPVGPPEPVPVRGEGRGEAPAPAHVPTYYGIPIDRPRSRVVFCLDVSQSMWGHGIDQAREELTRTLHDLPSTFAFDVVAFNEHVLPWAGELLPAHPVVKLQALAWLGELETVSYTNLFDAVETAFGEGGIGPRAPETASRIDAIFLLSDGAPNRGRYRTDDRVVEGIAALSRGRVPVHTIGAGEEVFPLLRRIAAATGGRFVDAFEFD